MIKFGTGGWRAVIGDEFTRANIQILAEALSRKMQDEGVADQRLCIGYDRRFLSKESVKWACEIAGGKRHPQLVCKQILTNAADHVLRDGT